MLPSHSASRSAKAAAAACLLLCGIFPTRAATLNAIADAGVVHDSNLFLVPHAQCQAGLYQCADTTIQTRLAATAVIGDAVRGLTAGAFVTRDSYRRNSALNNTGYGASLVGSLNGQRGSVETNITYVRRLVSFQDVRFNGRATQNYFDGVGTVTHAVAGDFRLIAGGDYAFSKVDNPQLALQDYRRIGVRGGLGYYSRAGNILALEVRYAHSNGTNDVATIINGVPTVYRGGYSEGAVQVHLLYRPSVLINFDGHLGYARHTDHSGVAGNFSGLIGDAALNWLPRETLRFALTGNRSFQSSSGLLSNGVQVTQFGVRATGDVDPRLAVRLSVQKEDRDFRFAPGATALGQAHVEHVLTGSAGLTWAPQHRLSLAGDVVASRRTSRLEAYEYRDLRATLTLSLRVGRDRG